MWLNNQRSFKGTKKNADGDVYTGDWLNDIQNGKGVYRFQILRHIGLALLGVELAAIGGVVLIFTAADHALARMELAHDPAHHSDRAAAGTFKHRVAVIRVLVDNVLHRSLDLFQLHAPHPLVT